MDNILLALNALRANKMRSLLTMLGIIIGIASVIGIPTIGDSLSGYINTTMSGLGASNLTVNVTEKSESDDFLDTLLMFAPSSPSEKDMITQSMLDQYQTTFDGYIQDIAYSTSIGSTTLTLNNTDYHLTLNGVNAGIAHTESIELVTGRFIRDDDATRKVAIIADTLATALYPNIDPLGHTIELSILGSTIPFYIVGVYADPNANTPMALIMPNQSTVYIPYDCAIDLTYGNQGYSSLTIVPAIGVDNDWFLDSTQKFFESYYYRNDSHTVTAYSLDTMLESMNDMINAVSIAIACIAAISLLVGGIGVMNIMLVSITERTREIGTRVALGAKPMDIRVQFVVESIIICLIGGMIGMVLGIALANVGTSLLGFAASPSLGNCIMAISFSMAIGVFFGYYPANKAAKLDPIDALRYE